MQKADSSDGRNDSDSSYDGDVESLLCDSEEPTSDSEDDCSDMLRKGDIITRSNCYYNCENQLISSFTRYFRSSHHLSSIFHSFLNKLGCSQSMALYSSFSRTLQPALTQRQLFRIPLKSGFGFHFFFFAGRGGNLLFMFHFFDG